jgi:hypothetical protein
MYAKISDEFLNIFTPIEAAITQPTQL